VQQICEKIVGLVVKAPKLAQIMLNSAQPAAGLAAQVSAPSTLFFYLLTARSKEVNDVLT